MYHDLPRTARFWSVLLAIDHDLAEKTRKQACPCGGRLHTANYLRKPRGTPVQLPPPQCLRLSFCCDRDGCRKRVTPPSVRFLGPKVYLGVIVILISAMRQGPTPRRVRELSERFGADQQTIARWQTFWRRPFSPNAILEDGTRPLGAACRDRRPSIFAVGCLPRPLSPLPWLDTAPAVSRTDHGPRRPANQGLAVIAFHPQRMLFAIVVSRFIQVVTVPFT